MGSAEARRRDDDTLEIVWIGHITVADVERLVSELERAPGRARYLIVDARSVTGFDVAARAEGPRLVQVLRDQGMERMVAVSSSTLVRIAGSAVALVTRTRLEFADSLAAADRLLEQHRATAHTPVGA